MVRRALTDYLEEGQIRRGFLGVALQPDLETGRPTVGSIVNGSAAEKAGLIKDDKIIKVGNKTVSSVNQARVAISQTLPGKRVPIEVLRGNTSLTLYVVLGSLSEQMVPIPGIQLEALSVENRNKYDIPSNVRGVLVAESNGRVETFKTGVVLVEINGTQILDVADVSENLYSGINRFYVWYRGKYRFLAYRIP